MLTLPVLVAGLTAGAVAAAGPADAATVASGTTTVTVPRSFVQQAAGSGITATTNSPATEAYDGTSRTVAVTFPVTGGNANVTTLTGSLTHGGSLTVRDVCTRKKITLTGLTWSVRSDTVSALEPDGVTSVVLFDLGGTVQISAGSPQSYSASQATIDPAGASYLDSALGTTFFAAGQVVGSFATSYTYA